VTSWAEEFGKIWEFAWQISVSDPIFLLIAVMLFDHAEWGQTASAEFELRRLQGWSPLKRNHQWLWT